MSDTPNLSILVAFAGGLLSFLSPCVLPLVPSYLGFITGFTFNEMADRRRIAMIHALLFVLGFTIIPVPGHTDGSMALHVAGRYLFTGDHMSWDRESNGLRLATVYVWDEETLRRSAAKLSECSFEWVLPGHGDRMHLPAERMKEELRLLLERREEKIPIP